MDYCQNGTTSTSSGGYWGGENVYDYIVELESLQPIKVGSYNGNQSHKAGNEEGEEETKGAQKGAQNGESMMESEPVSYGQEGTEEYILESVPIRQGQAKVAAKKDFGKGSSMDLVQQLMARLKLDQ